jgi:hypothetical protein
MQIERAALLAAINNPTAPRDPALGIRMLPFGGANLASAAVGKQSVIFVRPSQFIAIAVRKIIFTSTAGAAVPFYVRVISGVQVAAILAGTFVHDTDISPSPTILLQTTNRQDQTGKGTIISGTTTVGADRSGVIYRHGDGTNGEKEGVRVELTFPLPVILWGDDTGGPPALIVEPSPTNAQIRASFYGEEWPLFTDRYE